METGTGTGTGAEVEASQRLGVGLLVSGRGAQTELETVT